MKEALGKTQAYMRAITSVLWEEQLYSFYNRWTINNKTGWKLKNGKWHEHKKTDIAIPKPDMHILGYRVSA